MFSKRPTENVYFHQDILLPDMWHFNQAPWESIRLYSRNKKVFQSGHMHGVHENACLTCLFIARNSPLVWAGRHKDISKHKLRPAKSWVARLISKRRQYSAEAKDPILVITLPPAPTSPSPPKDSQTLMLCQALWTSVSLSSYPCYVSAPFSRLALYQEASQSHATCHISNILLYS